VVAIVTANKSPSSARRIKLKVDDDLVGVTIFQTVI